jgi:hypothetical protein
VLIHTHLTHRLAPSAGRVSITLYLVKLRVCRVGVADIACRMDFPLTTSASIARFLELTAIQAQQSAQSVLPEATLQRQALARARYAVLALIPLRLEQLASISVSTATEVGILQLLAVPAASIAYPARTTRCSLRPSAVFA